MIFRVNISFNLPDSNYKPDWIGVLLPNKVCSCSKGVRVNQHMNKSLSHGFSTKYVSYQFYTLPPKYYIMIFHYQDSSLGKLLA